MLSRDWVLRKEIALPRIPYGGGERNDTVYFFERRTEAHGTAPSEIEDRAMRFFRMRDAAASEKSPLRVSRSVDLNDASTHGMGDDHSHSVMRDMFEHATERNLAVSMRARGSQDNFARMTVLEHDTVLELPSGTVSAKRGDLVLNTDFDHATGRIGRDFVLVDGSDPGALDRLQMAYAFDTPQMDTPVRPYVKSM